MAYALASRLERAVKRAGVKYRAQSGWRNRGRGTMGSIQSIMCHHTAGPASGNTPSLNVVTYGRPGLSGPLAQLFLARDGTVILVAAGRANHAGRVSSNRYSNSHSIGIEAEETGVSSWPAAQLDAYAKLCKALIDEFNLPVSRVIGHAEAAVPRGRKVDPNFSMNAFRRKVGGAKGGVSQEGGGGSTYKTVNKTAPLGLYDKDAKDHSRIADWQKDALGYTGKKVDGYFGPGTEKDTKALQRQLGVKDDGLVGDDTMSAWEKAGKPKLKKSAPSKPKAPAKPKGNVPGPGYDFPLPKGHYFGPKSGPNRSYSGFHNRTVKGKTDREWIKEWAKQLSRRGWSVGKGKTYLSRSGNDGLWGNEYAALCKAFQRSQGLSQDSLCGKRTWDEAFKSPVT